jgi:hypothetical protein
MHKIKQFEDMARSLVGDGKKPNLYFVSIKGVIVTITRDFETAYNQWRNISQGTTQETALEDRQTGTLASVEPETDQPNAPLTTIDDTWHFMRKQRRKMYA